VDTDEHGFWLPSLRMRARGSALATVRDDKIDGGGTLLRDGLACPRSVRALRRHRTDDFTPVRPFLDTRSGPQDRVSKGQPFTAPAARPSTMYFCSSATRITVGSSANRQIAIMRLKKTCTSPTRLAMITGRVMKSGRAFRISGIKSSCHEAMKTITPQAASAGVASGSTMRMKACRRGAPPAGAGAPRPGRGGAGGGAGGTESGGG